MSSAAANTPDVAKDYAFRFDHAFDPVVFGGELDVHGWLLHREGKPINGIRALVKRRFGRERIVKGRRKRNRPDVAAAFPQLADAGSSGFLVELRLGFGRSEVKFQVLDHDRVWRTFATTTIAALPLKALAVSGLTSTRRFAVFYLQHWFEARRAHAVLDAHAQRAAALTAPSTERVDLFATSKSNLFIVEIGELVAAGFRELGCESQLHIDGVPQEKPPAGTLQIVVTPHEYYNLFLTEKFSRPQLRKLTHHVHLLCTEQPDTGWFQSNLQWGSYAAGVADINPLGVAAYRKRGLEAHQLQLGYHDILAHAQRIPHPQRALDITFLGSMTDRREDFFAEHAPFFARHECHLRMVPLGFAKTKQTKSYLNVERRNELLSNSRILLNVHYSDQKYFEWHRMLVGLANGCCIITETCKGYGELVPGKHFIMVEPEYLVPCCEYFLAHPDECAKIANAGREFIEAHLRQSQTCARFLQQIEQHGGETAAGDSSTHFLAPDSPPAPLPPELQRIISTHTRHLLGAALKQDVARWFGRAADKPRPRDRSLEPVVVDPAVRASVIKKRAGYKARLDQQQAMQARGEQIVALHDNDAYSRSAEPRLAVLITLYNYAQHLDECVASVTRAASDLSEAVEIVIVNDASTDNSLARARDCMRKSQLPVRVVDKKFNTGLADARNTALAVARAPYVFMLDADNLVYPRALKQLLDVISSADYGAAYSMLCRFRGTTEAREGLLSYFDFDPQILVQYPYVDAMAMFRRETLLGLGGYDNQLSQIGWFGWEDYDMWLKFAQREVPVAFVPNILCLYRHHQTSMINTTNMFETELVHHFMDHYGDLLSQYEPRATIFGVDRQKIAEFRETQASTSPAAQNQRAEAAKLTHR